MEELLELVPVQEVQDDAEFSFLKKEDVSTTIHNEVYYLFPEE
jgi:hypothetical protein